MPFYFMDDGTRVEVELSGARPPGKPTREEARKRINVWFRLNHGDQVGNWWKTGTDRHGAKVRKSLIEWYIENVDNFDHVTQFFQRWYNAKKWTK